MWATQLQLDGLFCISCHSRHSVAAQLAHQPGRCNDARRYTIHPVLAATVVCLSLPDAAKHNENACEESANGAAMLSRPV